MFVDPCHPCGRFGLRSGLLVLAWPCSGYCVHFGRVNQEMEDFCLISKMKKQSHLKTEASSFSVLYPYVSLNITHTSCLEKYFNSSEKTFFIQEHHLYFVYFQNKINTANNQKTHNTQYPIPLSN